MKLIRSVCKNSGEDKSGSSDESWNLNTLTRVIVLLDYPWGHSRAVREGGG